eukprot:gene26350-33115_t
MRLKPFGRRGSGGRSESSDGTGAMSPDTVTSVLEVSSVLAVGEVAQVRFHDGVPHIEQVADVGRGEQPVSHDLGGDVGREEAAEAGFELGPLLLRRAGDVVG